MLNSRTAFERRASRHRRRIRRFLSGALSLLLIFSLARAGFGQSEIELKVKAAFLFNFAKFTQWPRTDLPSDSSFVIGCFSDPEFRETLEATVAGKTLGSRRIVVKQVTSVSNLHACQMVFIGRSKDDEGAAVFAEAKEMHILTVGESEGFTNRGGMIGFVPADGSVKFTINAQQAERAGLRLSSKLVGLAVHER